MADRILDSDPRVELLARGRQQLAHSSAHVPRPAWEELTKEERVLSLLEARNYLQAAVGAGLLDADADDLGRLASRVESLIGDLNRERNLLSLRDTSDRTALVMMRRFIQRLEKVLVNRAARPAAGPPTGDA
ncbi:hypothetical protein ACQEU6_08355 [Spirillospora sp. CA-108201]